MTIFNFNNDSRKSQLSYKIFQEKKYAFLLIESLFSLCVLALFATLFASFYGNIINNQKQLITIMQAHLLASSYAHRIRSTKKIIKNNIDTNFTVTIEEEKITAPKNFKLYRIIVQEKDSTAQRVSLLTGFIV